MPMPSEVHDDHATPFSSSLVCPPLLFPMMGTPLASGLPSIRIEAPSPRMLARSEALRILPLSWSQSASFLLRKGKGVAACGHALVHRLLRMRCYISMYFMSISVSW